MTIEPERVLSDFIDAWNAGRRPDVDEYLARVDDEARDALADEIASFLTWAPDPAYDEGALEEIAAEPAVQAALAAARGEELWPALLPRLRRRAALSTAQLASRLVEALGLQATAVGRTERYLVDLEGGTLDGRGLASRLVDALADALAVDAPALRQAWRAAAPAPTPAPLFRAEDGGVDDLGEDLELFADAVTADAGIGWDEVDRLFRGG